MSPTYQVLGDGVVSRTSKGTPFHRNIYRVNPDNVPSWIIDSGNEIAIKVLDYLETFENPPGYGIDHLVRTGVYAFLFGGKYFREVGANRAALLLAGLTHDIEKGEEDEIAASIATVQPWLEEVTQRNGGLRNKIDEILDLVALHDVHKAAIEIGGQYKRELDRLGGRIPSKLSYLYEIFDQLPSDRRARYDSPNKAKEYKKKYNFLRRMERLTTADIFDRTDTDRWIVAATQILRAIPDPGYENQDEIDAHARRLLTTLGDKKWFSVRDAELRCFDPVVESLIQDIVAWYDERSYDRIYERALDEVYESSLERVRKTEENVAKLVREGTIIQTALREILRFG